VREEREEKLIRCGQVYGVLAAFSLAHHGRLIILTHARRRPGKEAFTNDMVVAYDQLHALDQGYRFGILSSHQTPIAY
jgi:hypothetical protein